MKFHRLLVSALLLLPAAGAFAGEEKTVAESVAQATTDPCAKDCCDPCGADRLSCSPIAPRV